jgi:stress response protein SCP2
MVHQHQMIPVTRGPGDDVELGLSWDFFPGLNKVDLDAQAVVFDSMGSLVDACYYKQL